jgi:hypothetical protein
MAPPLTPRIASPEPGTTEIPPWAREVAASLAPRPSRASSIVSTRTRTSTTTLQDDAKSIDLNIGGRYFRISRDGSQITTSNYRDSLPPYPLATTHEADDEADELSVHIDSPPVDGEEASIAMSSQSAGLPSSHTLGQRFADTFQAYLGHNILNPAEVDIPSPVDRSDHYDPSTRPVPVRLGHQPREGLVAGETLSRNRSYKTGEESITVARNESQRRSVSQNDLPVFSHPASSTSQQNGTQMSPQLRRRNGVRLPSLMTGLLGDRRPVDRRHAGGDGAASASPLATATNSAGPTFSTDARGSATPSSPAYYGSNATGTFPLPRVFTPVQTESTPSNSAAAGTPEDQQLAPPMDTENDISNHYTRMIRFIDRDHRRALHGRDKEMARLRERLNEVDIVYRQELRARDFLIEDLKQRLQHLEETSQAALEKARFEVEDIWESRWKDRDRHLVERMRRIEAEAQTAVEKALIERESIWKARYGELQRQTKVLPAEPERDPKSLNLPKRASSLKEKLRAGRFMHGGLGSP